MLCDAGELAGRGAFLAPRLHEHAVLDEFRDARVAAAVGDEDVALRVPRHVGGTIEDVLLRAGAGRPATAAASPPRPHRIRQLIPAFRPSRNATRPCGSNFMTIEDISSTTQILSWRIDADLRGEHEAVDTLADLARELARCDRTGTAASRRARKDALSPATSSGGRCACRQRCRRANWSPRRRLRPDRCRRARSADSDRIESHRRRGVLCR